jgi:hypothetical protein
MNKNCKVNKLVLIQAYILLKSELYNKGQPHNTMYKAY